MNPMAEEVRPPTGRPGGLASDWRLQAALGLVVVGLAVAVGVALGRRSARPVVPATSPPALPEAHPIWDSWGAARAGDVEAYLACFTPEAREALEAQLRREGRRAFAAELQARAETALGVELGPPTPRQGGGLCFAVTVPHEDYAERFDYTVVGTGDEWKIQAVVRRGRCTASPP